MGKKKKILIVEDNESLREILHYALSYSGYVVETACDGLSGLKKLEEDSFDLLITDNHMPRMGGIELIGEAADRKIDIKTLLISGDIDNNIVEQAKEKGVFSCLDKPFSINILREMVNNALKQNEVIERQYKLNQQPQRLEAAIL